MDLTPYIETLRDELAAAAEAAGDEARAVAERLTAPLESAMRLALLDALSTAAGEITRELAPGSVDLRLRGREPSFVVTPPPAERPAGETAESPSEALWRVPPEADDATMTRINLRLTEDLKERVEEAAREAGLSVNAWLVRSAAAALGAGDNRPRQGRRTAYGGDTYTGWVR
jgi:hypothetical protein